MKRAPKAVRAWEMLGQAKVCLKVDSEEELLSLAAKASAHGLINYVVVRLSHECLVVMHVYNLLVLIAMCLS